MGLNFTPIFNNSLDIVHINSTYTYANQPPLMTTPEIFILTIGLGIGLLLLSALSKAETCNDLSGILASIFLFVSAIQAFAVDTITGIGAVSNCLVTTGGVCSLNEWVLMENHTIYHYDLLGVVLGLVFLVSLANLYRLWTDYRRIIRQQEIEKTNRPVPQEHIEPKLRDREQEQ
jgi:hypothetical protein